MKKYIVLISIAFLTILSTITTATIVFAQDEIEGEIENQKRVIKYFAEHDVPSQMKENKDSKFSVYQIEDSTSLDGAMIEEVKTCKQKPYLIEVEIKKKVTLKYLYCLSKSEVRLISAYQLKNKKWRKIGQ